MIDIYVYQVLLSSNIISIGFVVDSYIDADFFRLKKAIFPAKSSTFAYNMPYIFHSESLYM